MCALKTRYSIWKWKLNYFETLSQEAVACCCKVSCMVKSEHVLRLKMRKKKALQCVKKPLNDLKINENE